jgi:hypothetical protein
MKTLATWAGKGFPIVSPEVAESRAAICGGCPERKDKNQYWLDKAAFDAFATIFNKVKHTKLSAEHLGKCGVCGCALDVKVWMDGQLNLDNHSFPKWCWVNPTDGHHKQTTNN